MIYTYVYEGTYRSFKIVRYINYVRKTLILIELVINDMRYYMYML